MYGLYKTIQVEKANEYLEVLAKEKSDAENLLKSANEINQSRRNLEQNMKFLDDNENLHDLGIAFGISGIVIDSIQCVRNRPNCIKIRLQRMKVHKNDDLTDEYLALVARHVISQINSDSFEITDDDWTKLNLMLLEKTASGFVPSKSVINSTQVRVESCRMRSFYQRDGCSIVNLTLLRSRAWIIYRIESNYFLIQEGLQIEVY